jgi:hypothetical protein
MLSRTYIVLGLLFAAGQFGAACIIDGAPSAILSVTTAATFGLLLDAVSHPGDEGDTEPSVEELAPLTVPDCVVIQMPSHGDLQLGYPQ